MALQWVGGVEVSEDWLKDEEGPELDLQMGWRSVWIKVKLEGGCLPATLKEWTIRDSDEERSSSS